MTLEGDQVRLVPLEAAHVERLLRYSAEPRLWDWWMRKPPLDGVTLADEVGLALSQREAGERVPFAIELKQTGELIGSTSLFFRGGADAVEIGATWLGLPFHNSGLNRECKRLLIIHAFETLGKRRVVLQTDELNERSRRAIERLGAKFVERREADKVTWNGRVRTSLFYEIGRDLWRAGGVADGKWRMEL